MNSEPKNNSSKGAVTISRDHQKRDIMTEAKLDTQEHKSEIEVSTRRGFFKAVVPASGKALAGFLRNFKTTIATVTKPESSGHGES